MPSPKPQQELAPAQRYLLMVGKAAPQRIHGWLAAVQVMGDDDATRELWEKHRADLLGEASACGFTPVASAWFDDAECMDDNDQAARAKWGAEFCERNKY